MHRRAPSWGWQATLLSSLASLALQATPAHAVPAVDVGMTAAFAAPPYLTELLETAAQENASSYFPLLDRIASGAFRGAQTDRDVYDTFVALLQDDGLLHEAGALSTFNWALSLRSAAPQVEAHFQFYRTAVNQSLDDGCQHWILWEGAQYCSPSLEVPKTAVVEAEAQTKLLPFDHALGDGSSAILYTDITDAGFGAFHAFLADKARRGELSYRVRHVRRAADIGREDALERLPVSGYGVKLALKRTDYIVIDDRETEGEAAAPDTEPREADTAVLDDGDVADVQPLSKSELAPLGLCVADFIAHSADPLETLVKLTQDLPKHAHTIAAHNASRAFVTEHRVNRMQLVPAGANVLWINGLQLPEWQTQPLGLLGAVRRERQLVHQIGGDLGLTSSEVVDVLSHEAVAAAAAGAKDDDASVRFDWRDNPLEDGRVILWLNNLEKDSRYAEFPAELKRLLQGGAPGQIPPVRRDIFNHVYAVDLSQPADALLVVEQLQSFVRRRLPVRFGIVPLVHHDGAAAQAKVAYHLLETYGLATLLAYLEQSLEAGALASPSPAVFAAATTDRKLRADATPMALADVLVDDGYAEQIGLARHWARRLGAESAVPPIFVDGILVPRDDHWLQAIGARMGQSLRLVQQAVYYGHIDDSIWVPGFLLADAVPYRNAYVFPSDTNKLRFVDVTRLYREHAALLDDMAPFIEADDDTAPEDWAVLTLVADLDTDDGLQLLFSALQLRRDHPGVHLEVVHNPAAAVSSSTAATLRDRLADVLDAASWEALKTHVSRDDPAVDPAYLEALGPFRAALAIDAGAHVVVLNGRVVGPIAAAAEFDTDAFAALLQFEQASRIQPVYDAVAAFGLTDRVVTSPRAAARLTATAAMSAQWSAQPQGIFEAPSSVRTAAFRDFQANHTAFTAGTADEAAAAIHLTAVLNPASEQGQRWAPLLRTVAQLEGVFLRVFLNPQDRLDELPVKRFYRAVGAAAPAFDGEGHVSSHVAHFGGLPAEALLNLGMDVPPAWLVAPKVSVHDLDNIRLSTVRPATADVTATYELENILVEGHSREVGQASRANYPPRGAQLELRTAAGAPVGDTIVMANLGYFQFKANPGSYRIALKQGRSADVYALESAGTQGLTAVAGDEGGDVTLVNFEGATLFPRLRRRDGMEEADVLVEEKPASAVAQAISRLGGFFKGGESDKTTTDVDVQAEINVFSVASGHLYERMLNIMMVSVMKNTKHTVKFWFIEQFLSPSFKDFIPTLAAAYGFRYEMVTYKWPHWLRQQTEKQREIWGYKILFLDVLFPLSLDKVIFVDADQIVRTDLMDLVQTDLHGAPYGFTPMCDSRTEMEGFRFWKQGYWHKYLRQGTVPYHISALYVVDLRRFRALGAGDRLRQTYHTLSADPNSLANLDQDLPNHMQFHIPIHSLDQDWLWCETWCSDEALKTARTIDLCNNPLTKEPKLDRARRQVPEWTVYDDEIAALTRTRRRGQGMPMHPAEGEENEKEEEKEEEKKEEKKEKENEKEEKEEEENKKGKHSRDEL